MRLPGGGELTAHAQPAEGGDWLLAMTEPPSVRGEVELRLHLPGRDQAIGGPARVKRVVTAAVGRLKRTAAGLLVEPLDDGTLGAHLRRLAQPSSAPAPSSPPPESRRGEDQATPPAGRPAASSASASHRVGESSPRLRNATTERASAELEASAAALGLRRELARLQAASPEARLPVPADARPVEIRGAFVAAARPFHPDRFRKHGRADLIKLAEEIYLLLVEAEATRLGATEVGRTRSGPVARRDHGASARALRSRPRER